MPAVRVSSKFQITLPASAYRALHIRPGDRLEVEVAGDHLELRKIRPDPLQVVAELQEEYDFRPLHRETGGDAVRHLRTLRWGDDQP